MFEKLGFNGLWFVTYKFQPITDFHNPKMYKVIHCNYILDAIQETRNHTYMKSLSNEIF